MKKKVILAITGIRSEYDIMSSVYKEIKKQQAVLLGRKQRGQLTVEDEYKLEVMTRELKKEENLERKNGKKALKAETARRRAYEAKRLLKIGVFM